MYEIKKFWARGGAAGGRLPDPPLACNETHNMVLAETYQSASNLVLQDQHQRWGARPYPGLSD